MSGIEREARRIDLEMYGEDPFSYDEEYAEFRQKNIDAIIDRLMKCSNKCAECVKNAREVV